MSTNQCQKCGGFLEAKQARGAHMAPTKRGEPEVVCFGPTKTKHTPGPWSVLWGPAQVVTGDRVIANPVGYSKPDTGSYFAEYYANTRLIAAAPELLEALEYLIQDKPGTEQFDRWYETRVTAARAAIAKAKGDES